MHPQSNRNLLFGVLAVQMNFVSRDDFVAGIQKWVADKEKPLSEILCAQGKLTAEQASALEIVIVQHLKAHGNDAERGLRALTGASTVASAITPIEDADVRALLAQMGEETASYHLAPAQARYRKVQFHREGGQGQIFLADDTELHRRVAMKEIKPKYADDQETRQRFRLEAEITGNLQHPGVVPVYGLGSYPDGRPYYAMRFISDERLTDAIADYHGAAGRARAAGERAIQFRQQLRRFIDVCNTIAYAHDRGVVHRDLKPGNIMLGKFGETLVIDWGMVKTGVEPRPAESVADEPPVQPTFDDDLDATRQGEIKGTYRYMSPEQADGRVDLVGKASDIYSLGTTLYEVLTGLPAFSSSATQKQQAEADIRAKVIKAQFNPPWEANPGVPAALDAICRKAMALKPSSRYATALMLAADIEHWLADEPVSAYREPWTARAGRWGRRHRSLVVGTAAALVVAVVALATSTGLIWAEQRETLKQKQIADGNFAAAREQFLSSVELIQAADVHFASDPALHPKRKELLKNALQFCRDFAPGADDRELQKRAAVVYRYSANVHRMSDETEAADPLYREAITLYEGLAKQVPEEMTIRVRLVETLRDQSSFFVKVGRLGDAKTNLERVEKLTADMQPGTKASPGQHQVEANMLLNRGFLAHRLGEKDALEQTERAAKKFEELTKLPASAGHLYNALFRIAALNQLAILHREAGDLKKARDTHKDVLKLVNELLVKDAAGVAPADYFSLKAQCALEQSRTLARVSDEKARKAAETNLGLNVEQWNGLAASYPLIPYYRNQQAFALQTRGQVRLDDKRLDDARKDFDASRIMLEKLVAAHPQIADYHGDLGLALAGLARTHTDEKDANAWLSKARAALGKAVELSPDDVRLRADLDSLPK